MNWKAVGILLCIVMLCLVAVGGAVGTQVDDSDIDEALTEADNTTDEPTTDEGPTAAFEWNPNEPSVGEEVTFDASDSTGDIEVYRWDFTGDEEPDVITENPVTTWTFDESGDQPVVLQVEDVDGETDIMFADVPVVSDDLTAIFDFDPGEPLVDEEVTFDGSASVDPNGDIVEYRWDFTGDGSFDETTGDPVTTWTYSQAGEYDVTLEVENDTAATDGTTEVVEVLSDEPTAIFEVAPETPLVDEPASFDARGSFAPGGEIVEYRWDFTGDGTFDETTSDPLTDWTYDEVGTYAVTLEVESNAGGTDQTTEMVEVTTLDAAFEFDPESPVVGEEITFDAGPTEPDEDIVEYRWDFTGDGTFDAVTGEPVTTWTYDSADDYPIMLEVENEAGGVDQESTMIEVGNVRAAFEFTPAEPFVGEEVTFDAGDSGGDIEEYRWDFTGDRNVDVVTEDPVATWTFDEPGDNGVQLEVETVAGETDQAVEEVPVLPADLTAVFEVEPDDPEINEEITFDASDSSDPGGDITEYRWDFTGDGEFEVASSDPVATWSYDTGDEYDVTLEIENATGATDDTTETVEVTGPDLVPAFEFEPAEPFVGEEVTFNASLTEAEGNIEEYRWDFTEDGEFDAVTNEPVTTWTFDEATDYDVLLEVDDEFGQTADTTNRVFVEPEPEPFFEVSIENVNTPVEGEDVEVTAEITNTGDADGTQTVELDAEELGGDTTDVTLEPNASTEETLTVSTGPGDAGSYEATVSTEDDEDDQAFAVLEPAESALSGLNIASQGADATIPEGDNEDVSVVVENVGDVADSFEVSLEVGEVVEETESTVELGPGETEIVTFAGVTGTLDPDEYDVTTSTADDEVAGSLTVEGPPESALSALDIAGQGGDGTIVAGDDETVLVDVENVGGQSGSFEVSLAIGEAVEETESTVELDSGETDTVAFDGVTGALDAGEYSVDVSTEDDAVTGSLSVQEPAESALSGLNVAGQGPAATIMEGDDEDVSVVVENVGEATESFEVTLDIGDIPEQTEVTGELAGGESETVTFEGATGFLDAGEYSVDVTTDDDAVTGTLTVEAPAESVLSGLDIAGQGPEATITEGDDEDVSVVVENVGDKADSFEVSLTVGALVEETDSTAELGPGETETVVFESVTGDLPATDYTVEASTADDAATGSLLVETPAESELSALDIAGQGTEAAITEGDDEDVTVVVENVGDQEGSFGVTLAIGETVEETESTTELGPGQAETVTFQSVTGAVDAGEYTVTVSTPDDAVTGTLTVEAPAESALSGLDIAGQGPEATITEGEAEDVFVDVANVGDQTGSFEVTLAFGDAVEETESTAALAGGETETVIFEAVTGDLDAGGYSVDVTTADDAVSGTVTVEAPAESALSGLDIAGQGAEAAIDEGVAENVAVDVENVGEQSGSFEVTLAIGDAVEETESTAVLEPGESESVVFESVTAALDADEYSVDVSTADDTVTGTLTVEGPAESALSGLDIAGQGEDAAIPEGADEDVAVDVANVGDEAGSFEVTLAIGAVVEETASTAELGPGETETVVFESVTEELPPTDYTVEVSTDDDAVTGSLLVQEPPESALSGLDIAGQGTAATITEGDEEDVSVVVENVGDQAASFEVELAIGAFLEETEETAELAAGESETVVFESVTGGLPPTDYSVDVTTESDGVTGTLSVEEPPESAVSNLNIAGQGTEATITEGADEQITVDVENVGDVTATFDVTLEIGAFVEESEETTELEPGETETVTFDGVTDDLPATDYSVDVSTGTDETGGSLAVDAPAESVLSALDIAGQGSEAAIDEGDEEAVSAVVENVGDQAGSFEVSLGIGDAVEETESTAELEPGETETVVFEGVTAALDAGEYGVTVSTAEDSVSGDLLVVLDIGLSFPAQNATEGAEAVVQEVASGGSEAMVLVTYEDGDDSVIAGVANGTFDGEDVTVALEAHIGFPDMYTTHLVAAENVSESYEPGDSLSAETAAESLVTETARVTTVTGAPDIEVIDDSPAKDTTGDGLLNDVRGSGGFNVFDVQTLFSNYDEDGGNNVIQNHSEFFNFQGTSADEVTIFDIQVLFGAL